MGFVRVLREFVCLTAVLLLPSVLYAIESETPKADTVQIETTKADTAKIETAKTAKPQKPKKNKKEVVSVSEDFSAEYKVSAGGRTYIPKRTPQSDSLRVATLTMQIDSLVAVRDSLAIVPPDTVGLINLDSLAAEINRSAVIQQQIDALQAERTIYAPRTDSLAQEDNHSDIDSTALRPRYNRIFRDSLSFPLVAGISVVVPGFAQFYEGKYWKLPVQYASIGLPLYFGLKQNKIYKRYSDEYNYLKVHSAEQSEIEPVQTKMYRHDSYRTLLFGAAAAAYMGFMVDGIINYPSDLSRIQKATTLSMVCPGAGQVYNGSYWKVPIVVGGIATMFYVVDWNSRGYNRFKIAYEQVTDDDPTTVDEWNGAFSAAQIKNYKDLYRRNRDLAIIGLVGVYLLQVADAHIDAHMRAYDITDDLSMTVQPYVNTSYGREGYANDFGFNLALHF